MSVPAAAVAGPVLITETSTADVSSEIVETSFSTLGSVSEVTLTLLVKNVRLGVSLGILTVRANVAVCPAGYVNAVQVIVPPAPAAGVVQFSIGPLVCMKATNVIVPGSVSV